MQTFLFGATNYSAWVKATSSGRLMTIPDALGNRILDYSAVGYRSGLVPLPVVPVKATVAPVAGDDGATIQAAINSVSAMPLDANGFRGAVLLTAGEYQISNSISINASGVVLRGVGQETNNGTVLRAAGAGQRTLVRITGGGSASTIAGTTHTITNNYVPVGATSFQVDSTSGLALGDRVFVHRNANQEWIHDLGMDLLGGTNAPDSSPWTPGGYGIDFDRFITRIEGTRIFINAPLTCAIEQRYGGGNIRKYTWNSRIQNAGIENLRGVSDFVAAGDEDHGWTFIQINSAEHVWVRDITSQYFGYACVGLYSGTRYATVRDCRSLDPVSVITGGRRYAFVLDDCQLCLVQNCYTDEDRHQFVTQSLTTGPNVFVDGLSDTAKSDGGPHHRWGTGAIWDCVEINGQNLNVQNRGNSGTGHGWAGANEVVWNCDASGGYVVQNPPTARNWLIGSIGAIENGTAYVGPHDPGTYDSHGSNVFPNSLYYAQMQDRMAEPALQTREYWFGNITAYTNTSPSGESVPVDSAWSSAISAIAGGQPLHGFDLVANSHWVPFTFNYSLSATEHVVSARLHLSMRAASSASSDDVIYFDSTTNSRTFASLGWNPISTSTNPTVRVLDLENQLPLLADGKFNVAVQNDIGIDWAMLQLEVAPNSSAGAFSLLPVADATLRGGTGANGNFGSLTTLSVKEDSTADNDRKALLRWDLSGVTSAVYQARVRLTPVSVGTNGIEHGIAFSTNDSWSETSVTWNNQPFAGKRFATWIPGTNAPLEFVVTPQVLEALTGDKQLSLQIYSLRNVGAAGLVDYASREAADANTRPQLILLLTDLPPTISHTANRTVAVNGTTGPIDFTVSDDKTPASSIIVTGKSSNTNIVPDSNIILGGSGTNRTVTIAPAPNVSGLATITLTATDSSGQSTADAFTLTVASHSASVLIWNGPGAGANTWSTPGNWSPAGPPESLDDVKFYDQGASGVGISNINNLVDSSFVRIIASLQYANSNGNHTTAIAAGETLTINGAGGLTVGTETDNGNTQVVNPTITGLAGGLVLNSSGNLIVRQATDPSSSSQRATLDMSGLDTFDASIGRILVGTEGAIARPTGTLLLAKTNTIVANGSSPAIAVGGAGGGSGNAGSVSHIYLGRDNAIFTDGVAVGRVKQGLSGSVASSLRFNPTFTNTNPLLGPVAVFRARDGIGRIATWNIGDSQSQGGTVNTAGHCDFTGGQVDALVTSMIVGRSSTGSGAGNPSGTLTLHAGMFDINTLQVGVQGSAGANVGNNSATGTVNVNSTNAELVVNSSLQLGITAGGPGTNATRGVLNISGGTVRAEALVCGSGTNNTISMNGGLFALENPNGPGLNLLALTNATLQLSPPNSSSVISVTNLTTGSTANRINIASLPTVSSFPATFNLIRYVGPIRGAGFNFQIGQLPLDTCGFLSNNIANSTVDLVVTDCIVPDPYAPPTITNIQVLGSSVIISGTSANPSATYRILTSTSITTPITNWTTLSTNVFDGAGNFVSTNPIPPVSAQRFYLLQVP